MIIIIIIYIYIYIFNILLLHLKGKFLECSGILWNNIPEPARIIPEPARPGMLWNALECSGLIIPETAQSIPEQSRKTWLKFFWIALYRAFQKPHSPNSYG